VLALVNAFLKAGILTETGGREDTPAGTPQGGILSPLIFNVAMSALDEHLHRPWKPGGGDGNSRQARAAPRQGPAELADRPLCGLMPTSA